MQHRAPLLRPTARVLLLDHSDRALLFRTVSDGDGSAFWFPPGGALEHGETHEVAAPRVSQLDVRTGGFTPEERAGVTAHRWWSVRELAAATERLVPHHLADVVSVVLRDGPPTHPVILPV